MAGWVADPALRELCGTELLLMLALAEGAVVIGLEKGCGDQVGDCWPKVVEESDSPRAREAAKEYRALSIQCVAQALVIS